MKYVANLLVAIHNVASAEAMVLGMKAGLPPQLIFDLVRAGAGNSRIFELRGPMMVKGKYDNPTMKIDVWDKDMRVIGDYASKIRAPTPLFDATKPIYVKARKRPRRRRTPPRSAPCWRRWRRSKRKARMNPLNVMAGLVPPIHVLRDHREKSWRLTPWHRCRSSEIRDGMRIDWDVPIAMDDGLVLRADVFRPVKDGNSRCILSYGPYAKGLAFQDGYPSAWQRMAEKHPDVTAGSTNLYQNWEVVDPEKWVPHDYVCVRVDSRGAGCSPGVIDHFSPRETKDFYDCIEWAGVQPWSNGKVGLNGISYYGINQWHVASLQPPHLAAMCVWEGAADWYRDMTHHGGILSTFWENWYDMQVKTVQYGAGERGKRSRVHGELVCGPETLSRGGTRQEPLRLRRRYPRPSARRRLSQGALADLGQGDDAAVLRRQLGRAGPASARQFRRLCARRLEGEMARSARHRALDAFLHRLRPRAAAQVLRLTSCMARRTAGQSSRRCCCRCAIPARNSSRAPRTNGRSRARNGPNSISIPAAWRCRPRSRTRDAKLDFDAMGDGSPS